MECLVISPDAQVRTEAAESARERFMAPDCLVLTCEKYCNDL